MTRLLDTVWCSNGAAQGEHPIDEALTNLGESYVDENGQPHPYGAYASLTCADKPEIKG
jgi:hypothetical protein